DLPFGNSVADVLHIFADQCETGLCVIHYLSVRSPYIASSIQVAHAAAYFRYQLSAAYPAGLQHNGAVRQLGDPVTVGGEYDAGVPGKSFGGFDGRAVQR